MSEITKEEWEKRLSGISDAFTELLKKLSTLWLSGRCTAIAQTKLEEAHMWLMQLPYDHTVQQIRAQNEAGASKIIAPVRAASPELLRELNNNMKK